MDGWGAYRHHALFVEVPGAPKLLELLLCFLAVERVLVDDVQVLAVLFGKQNDLSLFGSSHEVETVVLLGNELAE